MKNKKLLFIPLLVLASSTLLAGCKSKNDNNNSSSSIASSSDSETSSSISSSVNNDVIRIDVKIKNINVTSETLKSYDFTKAFRLYVNDVPFPVTEDMIDISSIKDEDGTYQIYCEYRGVKANATVNVTFIEEYKVTCSVESVEIKKSEVKSYNFLELFKVYHYDVEDVITSSMINSTVKEEIGDYEYTITYHGVSKTLKVKVIKSDSLQAVKSFALKELTKSELEDFDFTTLFYLYKDGESKEITSSMIDKSSLNGNVEVGSTYNIILRYSEGSDSVEETASIKIVNEDEIALSSKNIDVVPNSSSPIDLKDLFTITENGKSIEVKDQMIKGEVNYQKIGQYEINLSYRGKNTTSIVNVKKGLTISYATSDTIVIKKGTDKESYNFAKDFIVLLNGTRFSLTNNEIDSSKVDFSKEGSYEVTYSASYIEGTETKNISKTITYVVKERVSTVQIINDYVEVNKSDYDVLSNIKVVVNNYQQTLTLVKDNADIITTYCKIISEIDYNDHSIQEITIDVYANGVDSSPIRVTYEVLVPSKIKIESTEKQTLYIGDTFRKEDLFTINDEGRNITVTSEMVEGKVNTFKEGVYPITITYNGETKTTNVVVVDPKILGTYKTKLTDIYEESSSSSSSSSEDDGYIDDSEEDDEPIVVRTLDNLVIGRNYLKIDGKVATSFYAISPTKFRFSLGNFDFDMEYENGVMSIVPLNNTKMKYGSNNRSFVYFNFDQYYVEERYIINSGNSHVVNSGNIGYSIDIFKLLNKIDHTYSYYGMKTQLVDKSSTDFVYEVSYGFVEIDNLNLTPNNEYTLTFLDQDYSFKANTTTSGRVLKDDDFERKYANITFNGTIDGKSATLESNQYQAFTLKIDGKEIFSSNHNAITSQPYGGVDYKNNILYVISDTDNSIPYSYRFNLNVNDSTFTVDQRDCYFGLYKIKTNDENLASSYIFIDGYSKGYLKGFDGTTYNKLPFTYQIHNGKITIKLLSYKNGFNYGQEIVLDVNSLGNTLIVEKSLNNKINNYIFENVYVTDGALVTLNNNTIGLTTSVDESIDKLMSYFTIVTNKGELSKEEKMQVIDYSSIDFTSGGYYSVSVSAMYNNELVSSYYGIKIVDPLLKDSPLVGNFTLSNDSTYTLSINEFGEVTFKYYKSVLDEREYKGTIIVGENNSFIISCSYTSTVDGTLKNISINGKLEKNGILSATVTGDKNVSGYLYNEDTSFNILKGKSSYLYRFENNDEVTYYYSTSLTGAGMKVDVNVVNDIDILSPGSEFIISFNNQQILYGKVKSWNDNNGIILPDEYRGDYTSSSSTLFVDGFGISSSTLGKITYNNTKYDYYLYNDNLLQVISNDEIQFYISLNKNDHTFEIINSRLENSGITNDYAEIGYYELSTSNHSLSIDKFGIVNYSYTSSSSSSSSDDDYSTSGSSITYSFKGLITINDDSSYSFDATTIRSGKEVSVHIDFVKLADGILKAKVTSEAFNASTILVSTSSSISYVGNNNINYVSEINIEGNKSYFYYKNSSDKNPSKCEVEVTNDIAYGEKGSIFNVLIDGKEIISSAMHLGGKYTSASYGYVFATAQKGTYTPSSGSGNSLELDGFGSYLYDTFGECKFGTRTAYYKLFNETILEYYTSKDKSPLYYSLDLENHTYTRLSTSYNGVLKGDYSKVTLNSSQSTISFNQYSLGTYYSDSGTLYNCSVNHDTTNNTFTLTGVKVNDPYKGTISAKGNMLTTGVIYFEFDDGESFIYTNKNVNVESFSRISKENELIFKLTNNDEINYIYYINNKSAYNSLFTMQKESDSEYELEEINSIFSLVDKNTNEKLFTAKLISKVDNNGFVLANEDERKTFNSNDGELTLTTDGFTNDSEFGYCYLNDTRYTYEYSKVLDSTIIIYENNEIKYYCEYDSSNKFNLVKEILTEDSSFDINTYSNCKSPIAASAKIQFNKFGYFTLDGYTCKATFDENLTSFTFKGKKTGYSSIAHIEGSAKVLEKGLLLVSYDGSDSECSYFTTGTDVKYAAYSSKYAIYSFKLNGETKYLYSKTTYKDINDYIGYVNVVLENKDLAFGETNSIFRVYTLENEFIYRAKINIANNTNVGLVISDEDYGTYTNNSLGTLILDGFGNCTLNEDEGTYSFFNGKIVLSINNQTYYYVLDKDNMAFNLPIADSLKDKTFENPNIGTFLSKNVAISYFFNGFGEVIYKVECDEDSIYSQYISKAKTGVMGSYTIEGNQLTITFPADNVLKCPTFVYKISDDLSSLTLESTNTSTYWTGYSIKVGTVLNLKAN